MDNEIKIEISLDVDGTIIITRDGTEFLNISKDNREISAQEIYQCFDYTLGKRYYILKNSDSEKEDEILNSFYELMDNIAQDLNKKSEEAM